MGDGGGHHPRRAKGLPVQGHIQDRDVVDPVGQQAEGGPEQAMLNFVDGRSAVLVCTTIIESGLDIPNVNTIIIHRADKLGLAQLYQLRGRVGRNASLAYAYLLYDRQARLTETAQRRLQTIFEATELGAGFQIALRDLEIRGAGNLLGAEQSGHMAAVGFELYCHLLSQAVERLRALKAGEAPPPPRAETEVNIDLPLSAHLPESYVPDLNLRLALYQRMAQMESVAQVDELAQELTDRFQEPPPLARNLLYVVRLRVLAMRSAGADGADRAATPCREHAEQRALLEYVLERLRDLQRPSVVLGRELRNFAELLRDEMEYEESTVLPYLELPGASSARGFC